MTFKKSSAVVKPLQTSAILLLKGIAVSFAIAPFLAQPGPRRLTCYGLEYKPIRPQLKKTKCLPKITPCTSVPPDFPISPGKMRPPFYPTAR